MGSGRHAGGSRRGIITIALVVALVAAVAGVSWVLMKPEDAATAGGCDGRRNVVISVNDAMQGPMQQAVTALSRGKCFPAQVRVESPTEVENSFFSGGRPDLWVADTPARVDRLSKLMISTTTLTPSLASTPVGLVGGQDSVQHTSWLEALVADEVVYDDPGVNGAVALTLMAPVMERAATKASQDELERVVVLAAQNYGEKAGKTAGGVKAPVEEVSTSSKKLAPVTEQEFVTELAERGDLVDRTPASGAPLLTFPLVKANGGAPDTDLVADQVTDWFASDEGRATLAESGFRGPDGEPLDGKGFGTQQSLGDVPADEFDLALGRFNVLSVPSSLLAVFDVSGSMSREYEGRTRADFAMEAALTALDAFPDQARIGVWAFSINQGGEGIDHVELAPMSRLDDTTDGVKHSDFLAKQTKTLRKRLRGGTGLYDTTLAAYRKALDEFDRSFVNSVILLTDGANEDEGSISLKKLLERLNELKDPNREVKIIGIGITEDADMAALTKISQSTGGQAYLAKNPNDILDVLSRAMMAR